MTEQGCVDEVYWMAEKYFLTSYNAIDNGIYLNNPTDFDLKSTMHNTACWKGYVARYICKNSEFLLEGILIDLDCPLPINNIKPTKAFGSRYLYQNLK